MIEYIRVKLYAECKFSRFSGSGTSPSPTAEYTEEGLHKPYFNSANSWGIWAGSLLYNSGSAKLCPRKGHEFDEIEIPADYNDLNGISNANRVPKLIGLEVRLVPGVSFTIPGWIDSIEPVAVKGPSTNCRIKWHIDYWLMEELYRNYAAHFPALTPRVPFTFGQGRIKRGPASLKRPEPSEPRKWIYSSSSAYSPTQGHWVILRYVKTYDSKTQIITCFWEASTNYTEGGQIYHPVDLLKVYAGLIEEYIAIDADTILGCWISPIAPYYAGNASVQKVGSYYYYYMDGGMTPITEMIGPLNDPYVTDDDTKTVILDHMGAPVGTLPWGTSAPYLNLTVDMGSSSCNLIMTFRQKLLEGVTESSVMNTVISVPLPSVPITSNAKSSYVYSGERDYDMTMRELQKEQAAVSGIAGSGTSAIGGSIAGSMGKAGGGVGAVAGLAANLIGTSINYAASTYFDAKSQEAVDKLKSNQANNVLNTAGGNAWVSAGAKWKIVTLVRDAESAAELTAEQSELGYITDTYAADCSTIISQGGGLRIEGLEVKGDVPKEGRAYISALFARGVHLDIIN